MWKQNCAWIFFYSSNENIKIDLNMWLAGKEIKSLKHPDTKNRTQDTLDKLTLHERYD